MYKLFFRTTVLFFLLSTFISCSGTIGWSTVLWTIPDAQIADGEVVPVYLKSNIQHIYVIENPNTHEKLEVPLWQISEPTSKRKALKESAFYKDYQRQYARCALDGLPIRDEAVNTSKQVYRLRNDEIVRLLYEGNGTAPMTGGKPLEGKWLKVLTNDGHEGWCFSYNLRQFTMNADGSFGTGSQEAQVKETDTSLEYMLASTWYPDYYSRMINAREINLDEMQNTFGFDPGTQSGTVHIGWPDLNVSYPFNGITKTDDNVYKFEDTPVQLTIRSSRLITVRHIDSKGKPRSLNFITLASDVDIAQIISDEIERRDSQFRTLKNQGPDFRSIGYGTLTFNENNTFMWTHFDELVPSVISPEAQEEGSVLFKYFVPKTLRARFDGVITFKFNGQQKEVNFFYKSESNGLRLTLANVSTSGGEKNGTSQTTVSLAANPEVIYFSR